MRYHVTLAGRTIEVDCTGPVPRVDGEPVDVELGRVHGTRMRHLVLDGRSHALVARRVDRSRWDIDLDGERFEADVVDERTRAIRAMVGEGSGPRGPRPVRAPMPGLVVRLNVAPGDHVEAGQSVVIIEAMKMENDLKAEGAGVVSSVAVAVGEPVEKGAVLVEFMGEEPGD